MFRFVSSSIMQPLLQVPCGEWGEEVAGRRGFPFFVFPVLPPFLQFPPSQFSPHRHTSVWFGKMGGQRWGNTEKHSESLWGFQSLPVALRETCTALPEQQETGGGSGSRRQILLFRDVKWIVRLALSGKLSQKLNGSTSDSVFHLIHLRTS